jgi:hypothetical protein
VDNASGDSLEHVCVKIKCSECCLFISAEYVAPDVGKVFYDIIVQEIELIV